MIPVCVTVHIGPLANPLGCAFKTYLELDCFSPYPNFNHSGRKVKVTQSCLTLCDPVNYAVHGILQARILEWVAFPFSSGSSQPRDQIQVFGITGGFFTSCATGKPKLDAVLCAEQSLLSSKIFLYDSDMITSRFPGRSFLNPRILVSILLYRS